MEDVTTDSASAGTTARIAEPSWLTLDRTPQVRITAELKAAALAGSTPREVIRGWWGVRQKLGTLTLGEYLYYRLWDPANGYDNRVAFIGKAAATRMHAACTAPGWHAVADDKVLFDVVARGARLKTAETVALVDPLRSVAGVGLRSQEEVAAWLRGPAPYPLFMKPIFGVFSLGSFAADYYDAGTDSLVARGMPPMPVTEAAQRMAGEPHGYIVQRRLDPHPALGITDGATATVRVLVLLGPQGPAIEAATLKIPASGNVADNYWRPGNKMASLNTTTGNASTWVMGTGAAMTTGTLETTVPDWSALVDLVMQAAPTMRGLKTQSWDVAPTATGPVLLEVNRGGDLNLGQLASGRGALSPTYRAHLARNGYQGMKET